MRDMAKIVTIKSVIPMYQKDRICAVTFNENGYEVIVPKVEAIVGNKMVFIEADSILPVKPEWEFLRKRCFKTSLNGFLIKPMVMGKKDFNGEEGSKVLSWGLAVTPEAAGLDGTEKAGTDVTDKLEIRKYEPVEDASPRSGNAYPSWVKFCLSHVLTRPIGRIWQKAHKRNSGGFPTDLISKSDETTVQNMPWVLKEHATDRVYTTAKMEGQSVTALIEISKLLWFKKINFYVCSRNIAYRTPNGNAFWTFAKAHDLPNKFMNFYKKTGLIPIIQAEQCGPTIQNNIYNFPELRWFVYEIKLFNPETGSCTQLSYDDMVKHALEFGLNVVPLLDKDVELQTIMPDVDSAVKYAERAYYRIYTEDGERVENFAYGWNDKIDESMHLWQDYMQHEGVVVRSMNCDKDKNVGCSFKIKNITYAEIDLAKMAKVVRTNLLK